MPLPSGSSQADGKRDPALSTSHELHSSMSWNKVGRGGGASSRAWRVREGITEGSALESSSWGSEELEVCEKSREGRGNCKGKDVLTGWWVPASVRYLMQFKVGFEMRLWGRARALNKEFGLYPGGRGESAEDVKRTVSVSVN